MKPKRLNIVQHSKKLTKSLRSSTVNRHRARHILTGFGYIRGKTRKRKQKGGIYPVIKKPTFRFLKNSATDIARKKWIELVLPYAEYILHALRAIPWTKFQKQKEIYSKFSNFPANDLLEESNYSYYSNDEYYRPFTVNYHRNDGKVVQENAYIYQEEFDQLPSKTIDVYDEDLLYDESGLKQEFKGVEHYRVIGNGDSRQIYKFTYPKIKFFLKTPFMLVGGCSLEMYAFALDSILGTDIRTFVDTTADIDVHMFIDDQQIPSLDVDDVLENAKGFLHEHFTRKVAPLLNKIGDLNVDDSNMYHFQYELTYPPKGSSDQTPPFSDHILDIVWIVVGENTPSDSMVLNGYPLRNLWTEAQRAFLRTLEEKLTPTKYEVTQRRFRYMLTLLFKIYDPEIFHPICAQIRDSISPETIQTFWKRVWLNRGLDIFFNKQDFLSQGNNNTVYTSIQKSFHLL